MRRSVIAALSSVAVVLGVMPASGVARGADRDPWLSSMSWRNIGPARGGRVQAVAGIPGDRQTFYMGATGGGVWKTTDAGASWRNISDGFFKTGSVGDIEVAPSDPNVIYVGMGEADIRGNFSHGDGMYRSVDAGKTWEHIGLADTRQIGRVVVHPGDPDTVYVAALGHVWGQNAERGVFKTTDGGETWDKVLYLNEFAGAIDVAIDPHNPRVVYAGFWQVKRTPWSMESGGEHSGLYRSTDSGETWEELTVGLPKGLKGKIGVSPSPAQRDLVYAIVEAEYGGVFRSTDGGDSWRRVNSERSLRQRAWYYSHIIADPQDAETVYVMNVQFHKSTNGGREFSTIRVPHVDNHDLWIDPTDNQVMVNGNDGGANVSHNGGAVWSTQTNQPTAQFYRVTTDNRHPYRVYGAQQDNSTASVSSQARWWSNWERDLYAVGGCECGYIAVHPDDPDIIYAGCYGGSMTIYDHETGETRDISVWPENPMGSGADVLTHRFQWTFPIVMSPHDPEVVYVGGERVFRSTNRGQSWEVISPDLTTNDKTKQASSGGPITKDNTAVEYYCTVFTIAESPLEEGLIWAGSDDGLIHVSSDNGETWEDVTPTGMGDWPLISLIEASPHDADTAYAAVTRYKSNDFRPYVYKTTDRGETWSLVADGIDASAFVRSVREDPEVEGLLYAGTETGVYMSMNGGRTWKPLQLDLPVVPVTDVAVKGNDLVIATQGRSFWILDDLNILRELAEGAPERFEPALFGVAPSYRERWDSVRAHMYFPESAVGKSGELVIADASGEEWRRYSVKVSDGESAGRGGSDTINASVGMNLWQWNLRIENPVRVPGAVAWPPHPPGPRVPPGAYSMTLSIDMGDDETWETSEAFVVKPDPRYDTTAEDYAEQWALLLDIRDTLSEAHDAVNMIRDVRSQIDATVARAKKAGMLDSVKATADDLKEQISAVEETIIQTRSRSRQDPLNFPIKLNDKIGALMYSVDGDHKPTAQHYAVLASLKEQLYAELETLETIRDEAIPAFNEMVDDADVPAIAIETEDDDEEDSSAGRRAASAGGAD